SRRRGTCRTGCSRLRALREGAWRGSSGTSRRRGSFGFGWQWNEDADCAGVLIQVVAGDPLDVLFGDAAELVHVVGDVLPAGADGLCRAQQHGLSEDGVLLEEVVGLHLVFGLLEFLLRRRLLL